jgi:hypothetical protein
MFIHDIPRIENWTVSSETTLAEWRRWTEEQAHAGHALGPKPDWVPLVEPSGRLCGHVKRVSDDPDRWLERPARTPMSELAMQGRITLRPDDLLTDACRLYSRADVEHLSLVDRDGRYLGEVLRSVVQERLLQEFGVTDMGRHTLLLVESPDMPERPLSDLTRMAEAESLPICGILRLADPLAEVGSDVGLAEPRWDPDGRGRGHREGAEPDDGRLPLVLLSEAPFTSSFLSTVRRSGYVLLSEHPDLEARRELSDKADAFLHFLDI